MVADIAYEVKKGDVLRWNYTKDVGVVVGFDTSDGGRDFIVQRCDGRKIVFENDARLYEVIEGEEREGYQ